MGTMTASSLVTLRSCSGSCFSDLKKTHLVVFLVDSSDLLQWLRISQDLGVTDEIMGRCLRI